MCKVSIIVPVYNVERYLRNCMESLVNQTLDDIEIIAVNDGSPDNSLAILEEYEQQYKEKVKVFSIENHGVSYARNYGADHASGEYLLFVDSDDYIKSDMCEILYNKAKKDQNDVVLCGKMDIYESKVGNQEERFYEMTTSSQNFSIQERPFELCWISPFPWDKLVKRELFLQIRFPENIRFEDLAYVLKMVCTAKNIGAVKDPLYCYRRTTQGGFLNSFSEATLDVVKAFDNIMEFMRSKGFDQLYQDELGFLCAKHFFFRYLTLFNDRKENLALKKKIIRETQKFLNENFPGWKENHYIKYSFGQPIRKHLNLYCRGKKLTAAVTLFHYTPQKVWWLADRVRTKVQKLRQGLKKKSKKKVLIKAFKFLHIFKMPVSYAYTKAYERYPVDKNLILLESKHGEDIAGNIFNLIRVLQGEEYAGYRVLLTVTEKLEPRFRKLTELYHLDRVKLVYLRTKEYYRALASAGYLITDTSFPTYFIKKEEQTYLNTWHGTPLKGMGRVVPGREYGLGNVQRNFLIADYLLYQNEFSRDIFLDDYMLRNIYPGEVMLSGYPRNSALFNRDMAEKIRRENNLEGMQLIAYMPTWRGMLHKNEFDKQVKDICKYLTEIDSSLREDQVFFVKLHPFVNNDVDYSSFRHIRPFIGDYETYDFLNAADVLVTDYSSIMFDYAVTGKKIVLFTYDREEYLKNRGMYLDLNEIEFPVADTVGELIQELDKPNGGYPLFQERFCSHDSAETAQEVMDVLLQKKESTFCEKVQRKEGRKVLVYGDTISAAKQFDKIIKDVNELAGGEDHVYFAFRAHLAKKNTALLQNLESSVGYFPLYKGLDGLLTEYLARWLYLKLGMTGSLIEKKMERLCRREIKKFFGQVKFDRIIYYRGRSCMNMKMLSYMEGTKVCNLMDFDKKKYEGNPGYRSEIKKLIKGKISFDCFCVNKEFIETNLYGKTKDKITYCVMDHDNMNIHGLMEVGK
ncbi:MAG: bifunctional glycosyltransferase/CDP-glycerol:glycerophosphate glycerophosphotransferase [Ruminococcus sp.]|jgi:CDP-glycerol glycerophosphotransferase